MEGMHGAGYVGKGRGASMPSLGASPSQHLCVVANPGALLTPNFGLFWTLHYLGMIHHWPLVINSTSFLAVER